MPSAIGFEVVRFLQTKRLSKTQCITVAFVQLFFIFANSTTLKLLQKNAKIDI
ncbi:hypothetical protein HMPREF9193_01937 [Treponema lecithinolyticum ATCC 700332]|uniref:Uncharacterized protein n=1 Tax=Treponema lecithinolyticum ATCC 700332 TaxID=1321815 RepID=A0ABN0NWK9_TRELE|nr:hypothetical protein HMPREF9193_01937 [Treponema lecithinolyticum ATCC 700332]